MPGEIGEIVPEKSSIALPSLDETVMPDYRIRMVNFARYPVAPVEDILWSLRLGVNDPFGYHTHHGLQWITRRKEMKERHPEFYALYGEQRDTASKSANACLSNEGLFREHLRFLRFMFDMYDPPILSVWPDDGFTRICECEDCRDQSDPDLGREGVFSDYVWSYVNRVATELEKTHPEALELDGKLDDRFWHNAAWHDHMPGSLREHRTGAKPEYSTRFKFGRLSNKF